MPQEKSNDTVDNKDTSKTTTTTDTAAVTTEDKTTEETTNTVPEAKTVSMEAYKRSQDDMHKYKKQLREIEAAKKADELKVLKEKQDWQKIAELKEKEATEAREEKARLTKAVVSDKKMSAIREAAMKSGMLDSALDDIELLGWSDVEVETTSTGRINVLGAEDAVKRLKTLKPHWFGKSATKVNSKIPDVKDGKSDIVTLEKIVKLRKEAQQSGDYSAYEPAFRTYQAQLNEKV